MTRALGSLLDRCRRRTVRATSTVTPTQRSGDARQRARAVAAAIDRAMDLGLWEHANRLAQAGARLAPDSARLTERLARLLLAQDDAETALRLIEGCPGQPDSMRLMRAACLVQLGRKDEAHADLLCWSRKSTAPLDARLMLALLEWEAGDEHAAVLALLRNLRHLEDPRTIELLLLIAVARERDAQIREWADRLERCTAFGTRPAHLDLLLYSIAVPPSFVSAEASPEQITTLGMEIISLEHTLPSLVLAAEIEPQPDAARLIYGALECVHEDLQNPARAFECLARLALRLGDRGAAREWTTRGLDANPMSAPLRLLADRLEDRTPDVLAVIGREEPLTREHAA
jgi:hypothetical protein